MSNLSNESRGKYIESIFQWGECFEVLFRDPVKIDPGIKPGSCLAQPEILIAYGYNIKILTSNHRHRDARNTGRGWAFTLFVFMQAITLWNVQLVFLSLFITNRKCSFLRPFSFVPWYHHRRRLEGGWVEAAELRKSTLQRTEMSPQKGESSAGAVGGCDQGCQVTSFRCLHKHSKSVIRPSQVIKMLQIVNSKVYINGTIINIIIMNMKIFEEISDESEFWWKLLDWT